MTTEEMIETLIQDAIKVYKHRYSKTWVGRQLQRHNPVKLDGIEFSYWREWAIYKTGQYLRELCPELSVDVELDGNDSSVSVEGFDNDIEDIENKLRKLVLELQES